MAMMKHHRSRPGYINTVEFMLYLPIVILLFIAIVQFSKVLAAEARLAGASREGVRVAASGGNAAQIAEAVKAGLLPSEKDLVSIESNAVDSQGRPESLLPGATVVVRVSVQTSKVVSKPIDLVVDTNRLLVGQTVMRKE
jgi:hypothetical protein